MKLTQFATWVYKTDTYISRSKCIQHVIQYTQAHEAYMYPHLSYPSKNQNGIIIAVSNILSTHITVTHLHTERKSRRIETPQTDQFL